MTKRRYRKISVCIWNDAKFIALSHEAKLIVFFMLTHPSLTQLGALRGNVPGLACELGMELEAFSKAFEEVLTQGIVKHDGKLLFFFPNFLKYNLPESPNVVKNWHKGFCELPECTLKEEVLLGAKSFIDACSEGFQQAFTKAFAEELAQASPNHRAYNIEHREDKRVVTNSSPSPDSDQNEPVENPADDAPEMEPEQVEQNTPTIPPCPYEKIREIYNATCVSLPQCKAVSTTRKTHLKSLWRAEKEHQSLEWWQEFFDLVQRSTFLSGANNRGWTASFDWIIKPGNVLKILEESYLPKQKQAAAKNSPVTANNQAVYQAMMNKG